MECPGKFNIILIFADSIQLRSDKSWLPNLIDIFSSGVCTDKQTDLRSY